MMGEPARPRAFSRLHLRQERRLVLRFVNLDLRCGRRTARYYVERFNRIIVRPTIDIGGGGEWHNDQLSREGRHRLVGERLPRVCCRFRRMVREGILELAERFTRGSSAVRGGPGVGHTQLVAIPDCDDRRSGQVRGFPRCWGSDRRHGVDPCMEYRREIRRLAERLRALRDIRYPDGSLDAAGVAGQPFKEKSSGPKGALCQVGCPRMIAKGNRFDAVQGSKSRRTTG